MASPLPDSIQREVGVMKRLFPVTLIILLAISAFPFLVRASSNAPTDDWTWLSPLPQGNALHALWGSGPDNIYAAGELGALMHYDGQAWRVIEDVPNRQSILGLWGSGPNNIFAVGHDTLWHYDGVQWREMAPPRGVSSFLMRGVWGASGNDVYAVGAIFDQAAVFHYNGASWTQVNIPLVFHQLFAVWGSGPNNIFAVGREGVILHYDGQTWQTMNANTDAELRAIWGSGPNDIYVVGYDYLPILESKGVILHYDGNSWQTVFGDPTAKFWSVWGFAADDVYALADFAGVYHFDGQTWQQLEKDITWRFSRAYALWGPSSNDLFAAGDNGLLVHYDGATWEDQVQGPLFWPSDVWTDGVRVVMIGAGPKALRYDGSQWILENMPIGELEIIFHTFDIWGPAWDDLYAVGQGVIWHFDGQTWTQVYTLVDDEGEAADLKGVWGFGPDDVYVVGGWYSPDERIILHYDGQTWEVIYHEAGPQFQDIWGSGPDDLFVAAEGGMLHYDGRGWSKVSTASFFAVWGAGPNNVYAVGRHVFHYDGSQWRIVYSGDIEWWSIWGTGPNDVYALGVTDSFDWSADAGVIVHYDGSRWTRQDPPFSNILWDIAGTEDMQVMVGRGYAIWGRGNAPPPVRTWVTPTPTPGRFKVYLPLTQR